MLLNEQIGMQRNNTYIKGVLCVVLASFFWGTTGTAASLAPEINPLATGAFAMGIGGVLLLWNARIKIIEDKKRILNNLRLLFCGAACVAIYPLAFYSAMKFSGVAIGNLISIASAPFFSALLERLISKKKIGLKWTLSFVMGVIGIVLLMLGKEEPDNFDNDLQYWGIGLGIIAALTYACYSWAARQMIEKGVSSQTSMASMFGLAAVVLLPSLMFTGQNIFSEPRHIGIMLYMAVVPMFIGYLLFGYALRQIEASTATLITLLEPAIATLLAVTIVGEVFSPSGWYGFVFIFICLALQVVRFPTKQPDTEYC